MESDTTAYYRPFRQVLGKFKARIFSLHEAASSRSCCKSHRRNASSETRRPDDCANAWVFSRSKVRTLDREHDSQIAHFATARHKAATNALLTNSFSYSIMPYCSSSSPALFRQTTLCSIHVVDCFRYSVASAMLSVSMAFKV